MPRLSADTWKKIEARYLGGETGRALAAEYGVTETAVRLRFKDARAAAKAVAVRVVEAERELRKLPETSQNFANALIDQLRAVSVNLSDAATTASATSARLAAIAHRQLDRLTSDDPMEDQEVLQGISALSKMSNEAATVPMALLNANRSRMAEPDATATTDDDQVSADADEVTRAIARLAERG